MITYWNRVLKNLKNLSIILFRPKLSSNLILIYYSQKKPFKPNFSCLNSDRVYVAGIIPLENVCVRAVAGEGDKQWQFELFNRSAAINTVKGCKTDKAGTVVVGNHKVYKMVAASEEERNDWIRCIEEAMKDNPVHRIINEKKELSKQNYDLYAAT